eukprot:CAMPEP_0198681020 /NCGR_PEP_ID=MMETSP1468-20131203/6004_1 /TAXON_ID=1461545 /ORGANISM="Mantoniella sp, Strain CCMP1436" /LENGTH=104 /DNA_ID=CAMNT_0044422147 /DNA_START=379 /DNA_END=695 /DNA_ORIENTATION=-
MRAMRQAIERAPEVSAWLPRGRRRRPSAPRAAARVAPLFAVAPRGGAPSRAGASSLPSVCPMCATPYARVDGQDAQDYVVLQHYVLQLVCSLDSCDGEAGAAAR